MVIAAATNTPWASSIPGAGVCSVSLHHRPSANLGRIVPVLWRTGPWQRFNALLVSLYGFATPQRREERGERQHRQIGSIESAPTIWIEYLRRRLAASREDTHPLGDYHQQTPSNRPGIPSHPFGKGSTQVTRVTSRSDPFPAGRNREIILGRSPTAGPLPAPGNTHLPGNSHRQATAHLRRADGADSSPAARCLPGRTLAHRPTPNPLFAVGPAACVCYGSDRPVLQNTRCRPRHQRPYGLRKGERGATSRA
jgi:hypothetical protein